MPCDVRMRERREQLPLAGHALDEACSTPDSPRPLQRVRTVRHQAIDALGQPDGAHPAFGQQSHEPVRSDDLPGTAPRVEFF